MRTSSTTNVLISMVAVSFMLNSPTALLGAGTNVRNMSDTTVVVTVMICLELVSFCCMDSVPLPARDYLLRTWSIRKIRQLTDRLKRTVNITTGRNGRTGLAVAILTRSVF